MAVTTRGPRADRGVLSDRIIDAARETFAARGWSGTTIRGVARTAGVDAALVHYYFGSKDGLLEAVMVPPVEWLEAVAACVSAPLDERGEAIVRTMLWAWRDDDISSVLRSILLTAAHVPAARERLRIAVSDVLVTATAGHLDGDERELRAGLAASQVIGVALMRNLWEIDPLASVDEEDLVRFVAPTVHRYLTEDLG